MQKSKIKFSHFLKEDGTTCKSLTCYAGSLAVPEHVEDVELKLTIEDSGSIKIDIVDDHYYDDNDIEYFDILFKKIDWDNGYEFLKFFDNLEKSIPGVRQKSYILVGNRPSEMSDMIYSDKNVKNLQKMDSVLKKLKK